MTEGLRARCERYTQSRELLSKTYNADPSLFLLGAAFVCAKGKTPEPEDILDCREVIEKCNSAFLGMNLGYIPLMSLILSVSNLPQKSLRQAFRAYDALRQAGFARSSQTALMAFLMEDCKEDELEDTADRAYDIMLDEEELHPPLTKDDIICSLVLAMSGADEILLLGEAEACRNMLEEYIADYEGVVALSRVLSLGEADTETKCKRAAKLHRKLYELGYLFEGADLSALGVLALAQEDIPRMASEVADAAAYLTGEAGFGPIGTGRRQRNKYAAILAGQEFTKYERAAEYTDGFEMRISTALQIATIASLEEPAKAGARSPLMAFSK